LAQSEILYGIGLNRLGEIVDLGEQPTNLCQFD